MRILKNESGFNLMAVLAISVLVGMVSFTMIAVVNHIFRSQKNTSGIVAVDVTRSLAMAILTNANLCDTALRVFGGATNPTVPPTGTANLALWPTPAAPNPAANITFDSIEMPSGGAPTGMIWRGMSLGTQGNRDVTITRMTFSTTQLGVDLNPPTPVIVARPDGSGSDTLNQYPGWISIWLSEPTGGLRAIQIPLTIVTNPANGQVMHCMGNNSLAQICQELGGAIATDGSYQCWQTLFSKIMAHPVCYTAADLTPGQACPAPITGCGFLFAFTGFEVSGVPRCSCQQICP